MKEAERSSIKPWLKTCTLVFAIYFLATCSHAPNSQAPNPMPATTGFAEVNETRLYYESMGEGQPIVLIHGGAVDRRMWDDQVQAFAEHYRVIRYDLRGSGKSEIPKKRFSNVEDLLHLLRLLHVDKAYLLGLSRGGGVAADFTLEHPELVDALILASSNLGGVPDAYRNMLTASFSTARDEGVSKAVQVWLDDPYQAPSPENVAARQRFREIVDENLVVNLFLLFGTKLVQRPDVPAFQRISNIRVPTLILSGERDHPDARANYDRAAATIPRAKKLVIPGAAHLVNVDQPEQFNRAVLDFLSNLDKDNSLKRN